jgi:protein TonB
MTTMTFESISASPRRAAARRSHRPASNVLAAKQPIEIAASRTRSDVKGLRYKVALTVLVAFMVILHAAIIIAFNKHIPVETKKKMPPLTIEIAPPKPEVPPPPVIQPKPLPKAVTPVKRARSAPSVPIVRSDTPVDSAPSANSVQVATAAPEPVAAPVEHVTEPRGYAGYLHNPAPKYPAAAQTRGLQGQVVLKVHVLASGQPSDISVARSSGYNILDQAAITAVASWVFDPAKRGQTPIDGWVQVPLNFKLS